MMTSISNAAIHCRCILMLTTVVTQFTPGYAAADTGFADEVPRIVVSLAGMDLSTQKGADVAYGRIRTAAGIVCHVNESRDPSRRARARVCYRNAIDDAIAQANRPVLSALHARTMGAQPELVQSASR